jgi:pimeloyl-ACP methyl ester carboxylesterase
MFHTEAFARRVASTPRCQVLAYDRGGHWPMCEPEVRGAFNADVRAFLESDALVP